MFSQNIKEIKGFDGYFVSDDGKIFSTRKNGGHFANKYEMNLKEDKDGYLEVGLYKNGKRYFRRVHRLVAETFIPNVHHYPQINHIDGDVKNNIVSNLEWCTCQQNLLHSFRVLSRKPSITTAKAIKLTNLQTNQIFYFNSEKDCAYFLHMSHEHLSKLLTGKRLIATWKKHNQWKVEFCNIEDVTTIPKGSTK